MIATADKAALRAELKLRRARAYAQLPKAGEALATRLPLDVIEAKPKIVAGYVPIRDEMEPGGAMAVLRHSGARLCLPVVTGKDAPLAFRAWDFGQPLIEGAHGIRIPGEDAETVAPDLLLVPLLGWSQEGGRIGYGAGHYDRTLAALRAAGPVIAVGLAFETQRVWDLPQEPHDQPLDWIVTESAAYLSV